MSVRNVSPTAIAVSAGEKPHKPSEICNHGILKAVAIAIPMAEPAKAHSAARRLAANSPTAKIQPVTHESVRNTCERPFIQAASKDGRVTTGASEIFSGIY